MRSLSPQIVAAALAMASLSQPSSGQSSHPKPSPDEAKIAIQKRLVSAPVSPFGRGPLDLLLAQERVLLQGNVDRVIFVINRRFGIFNEREGYWPIEFCIGAIVRTNTVGGAVKSSEYPFLVKVQAGLQRDDFGDWSARLLPLKENGTLADIVCIPSDEKEKAIVLERFCADPAAGSSGLPCSPNPAAAAVAIQRDPAPEKPRKTKDVAPIYPEQARRAGIQGVVVLEITIDPRGKVTHAKILRSVQMLDQAAVDAVTQWEYEPTVRAGIAVPVVTTVAVPFRLQ